MSDLKPCPFCGYALPLQEGLCGGDVIKVTCSNRESDAEITTVPYGICCSNCGTYVDGGDTAESAIAIWNTRAPTEANARADELQEQLDAERAVNVAQTRDRIALQAKLQRARELIPEWENTLDHGCAATFFECAEELTTALEQTHE